MDELKIIEKIQNGNSSAFGEIYNLYIDKIYSFVYLKTYDKDIAEDITSEVFFKALSKIDSFKLVPGATFSSWIYRIAYNKVVDFYRTKKEEFSLEGIFDLGEEKDYGKDIDNKQKLKEVYDFINTLKQEHKQIIIMRLWDNLSYREISEITGKSSDNCKKIFSRNIKKINENIILTILFILFI